MNSAQRMNSPRVGPSGEVWEQATLTDEGVDLAEWTPVRWIGALAVTGDGVTVTPVELWLTDEEGFPFRGEGVADVWARDDSPIGTGATGAVVDA